MALYVDSAYLDEVIEVARTVPLAGVTTNPTILLAAKEHGQRLSPLQVLHELLRVVDGSVFMQPGATEDKTMFEEALAYVNVAPHRVVLKLPMTPAGIRVAPLLKQRGHRISFTAVTSVAQAYTAALAGADFVIPYYGRLGRAGIDARERVAQIAELLHGQKLPSRLLVASIKSPDEAASALLAGAQDLTVAPDGLLAMVKDPLSEQSIEKFAQDWQEVNTL